MVLTLLLGACAADKGLTVDVLRCGDPSSVWLGGSKAYRDVNISALVGCVTLGLDHREPYSAACARSLGIAPACFRTM